MKYRTEITRLGQIDSVGQSEILRPQYKEERDNLVSFLVENNVISIQGEGFVFVGEDQGENKLLYLDTVDCY